MGPLTTRQIEARAAAAALVRDATAARGLGIGQLAGEAGLDSQTVGDFLAGRRWPSLRSQAALERALGLSAGLIQRTHDDALSGASDTVTQSNHIAVTEGGVGMKSGEGVVTVEIAALGVKVESTFSGPEDRARAIAEIMRVVGLEGVISREGVPVPDE